MPFHYEVDDARRVVIGTAIGRLTGAELLRAQRTLVDDERFDPSYNLLVDFTGVRENAISGDDIRAISTMTAFSPTSRLGYVVRDPVQYGLLRMFQVYATGRSGDMRIFSLRAEADRWVIDGSDPT